MWGREYAVIEVETFSLSLPCAAGGKRLHTLTIFTRPIHGFHDRMFTRALYAACESGRRAYVHVVIFAAVNNGRGWGVGGGVAAVFNKKGFQKHVCGMLDDIHHAFRIAVCYFCPSTKCCSKSAHLLPSAVRHI